MDGCKERVLLRVRRCRSSMSVFRGMVSSLVMVGKSFFEMFLRFSGHVFSFSRFRFWYLPLRVESRVCLVVRVSVASKGVCTRGHGQGERLSKAGDLLLVGWGFRRLV